MNTKISVATTVRFERHRRGTRRMVERDEAVAHDAPRGRLPRISRLMALAIHFDGLIQSGAVANYAELARLGNVTRARVTQIMNLLLLAPEIQEEILFLPRLEQGKERIHLRQLQPLAGLEDWKKQRRDWKS
jgi:hypothetical protein